MIRAAVAAALSAYAVTIALAEPYSNEPAVWLLAAGLILLSIAVFPSRR